MRNKDNTDTPKIIIMIITITVVSFAAGYYLASAHIAAMLTK